MNISKFCKDLLSVRFLVTMYLLIGFLPFSGAQSFFKVNWEKTFDDNTSGKAISSLMSSDGNIFLVGETSQLQTSATKILFLKINKEGRIILEKSLGKNFNYSFKSVIESRKGGFYILCSRQEGSSNPFICLIKADNEGNLLWETTAGTGGNEIMNELVETSDDGVLLCGFKEIKADRDTDAWLIKFNKKGVIESQSLYGSRYINDEFNSITSDNKGNYIICGYTSVRLGGEKIPYFLSVDSRGNKLWEKSYPEFLNIVPGSVYINREGLIVCLNNEFSTSGESKNIRKFILKTSGEIIGNFSTNRHLNIAKNSYVHSDDDQLVMISASENPASLPFLIKLENDLNPLWVRPITSPNTTLLSLNKIDDSNYLSAGSISVDGYKQNYTAIEFQDNSAREIESFIKERLITVAKMKENESESDFIGRIGKSGYDNYYSRFRSEAIVSLKLIPQTNAGDTKKYLAENQSNDLTFRNITDNSEEPALKGNYYALLIAINDYKDPVINSLDKPISDAQKLFDVLVNDYVFEKNNVTFLKNPTREQIISSLDRLEKELTKEDNLIIFYAGHGYWNNVTQKGYWLPSDATRQNTANWIGNSTISDYIRSIPCRHTLLVADACFSGSIFKTRAAFSEMDKSSKRLYELTSRKAMTSGTLTEVPDKSVFVEYMIKRLDDNQDKFLASEQLFFSFKPAVLNNTENIPQFGVVANSGDEGGDFIFVRRVK